jgi:hypothetical protein
MKYNYLFVRRSGQRTYISRTNSIDGSSLGRSGAHKVTAIHHQSGFTPLKRFKKQFDPIRQNYKVCIDNKKRRLQSAKESIT